MKVRSPKVLDYPANCQSEINVTKFEEIKWDFTSKEDKLFPHCASTDAVRRPR